MSVPERIGRYDIVSALSTGGMGDVLLARVAGVGGFTRHVVLKTVEVGDDDDHDAAAMFLDEARVLGGLHHQHIVPVYEIDRADGRLYVVMDYIHGHTTHEIWQRCVDYGAALPFDFALTVVSAAAAGLHYAHTRRDANGARLQIVHRDVSPSNLMIGFDGAVKLIDFGIAKAANRSAQTQAGFVKGKLGYMAPEQLRGMTVDARTDVFALGIVLYELTTMRRAFREESDRATAERIKTATFAAPATIVPDYPAELERIVRRALAVEPSERYPDADTMRCELEALGHQLELVLGDTAVCEVMSQLFDDSREPWDQRSRTRAETDVETSVEIDRDDTKPSRFPNRRAGELRPATEAVDQLIHDLDTPVRGTPMSRGETELGVGLRPVIPAPQDVEVTAVGEPPEPPMPVRPPPPLRPTLPTPTLPTLSMDDTPLPIAPAARAKPIVLPTKPATQRAGWIAAGIIGAGAIAAMVTSLLEPEPEATAAPVIVVDAAVPPVDAPVVIAVDAAPPPDATPQVMLVVITKPADATLTLAGEKLGKTPFEGAVDIRPGSLTLEIRRRGYTTVRLPITLDADVRREVTLQRAW